MTARFLKRLSTLFLATVLATTALVMTLPETPLASTPVAFASQSVRLEVTPWGEATVFFDTDTAKYAVDLGAAMFNTNVFVEFRDNRFGVDKKLGSASKRMDSGVMQFYFNVNCVENANTNLHLFATADFSYRGVSMPFDEKKSNQVDYHCG